MRKRGTPKLKTAGASKAARARAARRYRQFGSESDETGSESSGTDDGLLRGGHGQSVKDIKNGVRANSDDDDDDDDDDDEFDDDEDGAAFKEGDATRDGTDPVTGATIRSANPVLGVPLQQVGSASLPLLSSELTRDVTAGDMAELMQLRHGQAVRFLGLPNFAEVVTGTFTSEARRCGRVASVRTSLLIRTQSLVLPVITAGSYVRAVQPPEKGSVARGNRYRVARVVGVAQSGTRYYNPWHSTGEARVASTRDIGVEQTNKLLLVAVGSSDTVAATGLPRSVRICDISNGSITPDEFEAYRRRLAAQYSKTGDVRDRVPTVAEARKVRVRAETAAARSHFDADAVNKRLAAADFFVDSKLRSIPNLTHVRDAATLKLAESKERAARAAAGSREEADARKDADRYSRRLTLIAEEEARRRAAHFSAEEARLQAGRDVSSLTRIINAKVEQANRRTMEQVSEELRGKSAADVDADTDDNPYARRRTAPMNLWSVPVQAAAPQRQPAAEAAPVAEVHAADRRGAVSAAAPSEAAVDDDEAVLLAAATAATGSGGHSAAVASAPFDMATAERPSSSSLSSRVADPATGGVTSGADLDSPAVPLQQEGRKSISLADFRARLQSRG